MAEKSKARIISFLWLLQDSRQDSHIKNSMMLQSLFSTMQYLSLRKQDSFIREYMVINATRNTVNVRMPIPIALLLFQVGLIILYNILFKLLMLDRGMLVAYILVSNLSREGGFNEEVYNPLVFE